MPLISPDVLRMNPINSGKREREREREEFYNLYISMKEMLLNYVFNSIYL